VFAGSCTRLRHEVGTVDRANPTTVQRVYDCPGDVINDEDFAISGSEGQLIVAAQRYTGHVVVVSNLEVTADRVIRWAG
jgi:hypothetical protein